MPEEIQSSLHFADVVATPAAVDGGNPGPAEGRVDWNAPEIRALGLAAGGGWTTAADLALLYQPLLNGGRIFGGGEICKPETIALGTTVLTDDRHMFEGPGGISIAKLRGVVFELAGVLPQLIRRCAGLVAAFEMQVMLQVLMATFSWMMEPWYRKMFFGRWASEIKPPRAALVTAELEGRLRGEIQRVVRSPSVCVSFAAVDRP